MQLGLPGSRLQLDAQEERFSSSRDVVYTPAGDELVLMDLDRGQYYTLNEVGAVIWDAVREGATLATLVERVRSEYEAPEAQVTADVRNLLDQLLTAGLITRQPA